MNEVTTYYLEMKFSSSLKGKKGSQELRTKECDIQQFQFNPFLYELVGEAWEWTDRLSWSDGQWETYVENDYLRTWVTYYRGSPAGYYELQQQGDGDVEIASFGLAPKFIGQGFIGATSCLRQ